MPPGLATAVCLLLMATCFYLDRDKARVSWTLWIPVGWLAICASRTVGQWLVGNIGMDTSAGFEEGSSFDAAVFGSFVIAGLGVVAKRRRRVASVLRANWPLLLFFLYCAASISWSDFPAVAFKRWIKAVGDLTMVLIVLTDPQPRAALKRFLTWPGFVLVPLSILLIRYYPALGRSYSAWTGEAFKVGVATGKNGLGYVCLIFGLGSLWCIFSLLKQGINRQTRRPLLANLALLVLTLWLFNMAHSATSFACFFIGGSLMFAVSQRSVWRRPALIHGMVATVLFLVVYGLFINPKVGLTEAVGRDSTLTGRTRIWNDALRLTVNPVVGAGYESFWLGKRLEEIWLTNWEHPNQAHNGYLEVYLDLGWAGLALVATMIIAGYRDAVRAVSRAPSLIGLKIAFLVVAILYNCTEHAFRELHPVWIMFLLAVITLPVSLRREFE